MKEYIPQPIDTSDVLLSDELIELREKIAENVHEVWAYQRQKEGWTYGKYRDDKEKKNPCMVPYDNLTDAEKEYDRQTAMETLKLIIKLGYTIRKL